MRPKIGNPDGGNSEGRSPDIANVHDFSMFLFDETKAPQWKLTQDDPKLLAGGG